jgi:UDP-N-acetylmuramate--alanine ligase
LLNYGRFGQLGRSDLLVAEADEYDRRFLDYEPELALVTSVEPDHLDYFGTFDEVVAAFEAFLARIRPGGVAVLCTDDPVVRRLATGTTRRVTYGVAEDADWRLLDWYPAGADGSHFTVRAPSGAQHTFSFHLLGKHNALNATGVIAVAGEVGLSLDEIARGVEAFRGTRRRFEVVGTADGVSVVDDYAHHPTAIRVTLEAARAHYASAIWAVFQPHTAHRTQSLFHEFVRSFGAADHVYLVPTYRPAGREADEYDPTVAALAAALEHTDARSMSLDQAVAEIAEHAAPGDLVLVMGAGDVWRSEADLLDRLRSRSSS